MPLKKKLPALGMISMAACISAAPASSAANSAARRGVSTNPAPLAEIARHTTASVK